jgi:hypothetical protein
MSDLLVGPRPSTDRMESSVWAWYEVSNEVRDGTDGVPISVLELGSPGAHTVSAGRLIGLQPVPLPNAKCSDLYSK